MKRQQVRKGIILFSFFLFPALYYYLSPVLIIQASYAGIINGSWLVFAFLFISSFIFGRGFCGWLCPAAGCQEAIFSARNNRVTRGNKVKWFIWFPWIFAIAFFAFKAGGYHSVDFTYQTVSGLSITDVQSSVTYLGVLLLLIVLPAYTIGKRSFCHHLCWMAPFMILGRKLTNTLHLPSLKIQSDESLCSQCQTCNAHCPMSLPVEEMVNSKQLENSECILCGSCVDICKNKVIRFSFNGKREIGK